MKKMSSTMGDDSDDACTCGVSYVCTHMTRTQPTGQVKRTQTPVLRPGALSVGRVAHDVACWQNRCRRTSQRATRLIAYHPWWSIHCRGVESDLWNLPQRWKQPAVIEVITIQKS
eukprot:6427212-Amphidinium_carterae.1